MNQFFAYSSFLIEFFLLYEMILFFTGKSAKWFRRTQKYSLMIYLGGVLYHTILFREQKEQFSYQLQLFWSYYHLPRMWNEILLNILLFIPFGFLICDSVDRVKKRRVLFLACLFSFLIESIQFIFRIGVFELDDILHNTLGCGVGILFYQLICRLRKLYRGK